MPAMMPPSLNCLRTSCTTTPAVRPTARMESAEKRNGTAPPIRRPMKTFGSATFTASSGALNTPSARFFATTPSSAPAISMNDANSATAAMTAEPMAKPLVTAFVVLPTASRLTMMRSGSPWNSPLISAIPAALSDTGPKVSSDTMTPVVASMPMPHNATRYSENVRFPPPSASATPIAIAIATTAYTELSRPADVPERTTVAGPVSDDSAISFTGGKWVAV